MANIASMKARASTQALYICKRERVFVVFSCSCSAEGAPVKGTAMSALRKIKRVGKKASKFQYTATYQSVVVECQRIETW